MSQLERASFGSKLGVILATAGSAVGLGNIWRFPYMTGQNGGAIFIIIYVFCILLLGIPCMISEFIIGRHGQANTARAFRIMSGRSLAIWACLQVFLSLAIMLWYPAGASSTYGPRFQANY